MESKDVGGKSRTNILNRSASSAAKATHDRARSGWRRAAPGMARAIGMTSSRRHAEILARDADAARRATEPMAHTQPSAPHLNAPTRPEAITIAVWTPRKAKTSEAQSAAARPVRSVGQMANAESAAKASADKRQMEAANGDGMAEGNAAGTSGGAARYMK